MSVVFGVKVAAVLALVWAGAPGYGGAVPSPPFDLQGHRGARGLRPENTLLAFAEALRLGVSTLELDLGLTRDGVLVVGHDPRLSGDVARGPDGRVLEGPGPALSSLSHDELQRYDVGRLRPGSAYAARFPEQQGADGVRMPRLAEVVALTQRAGNRKVRFNVEIKTDPRDPEATVPPAAFAEAVVLFVRERGLVSRVTIQSFDWRSLERVREIAPEIERSCLTLEQAGDSAPRLVAAAQCQVWSPDFHDVSDALVREAHALRLKVLPWTVNEPEDMERLMDLGVDGIITDYPDRLRAAMAKRGLALPPATPVEP